MALKFAFTRPDGGVTILGCAPKADLERIIGTPMIVDGVARRVLSDEEYRSFVIDRTKEVGAIPTDVDLIELPEDWTPSDNSVFRDAWVLNGKSIEVDMPKAREIHRSRLRMIREPLLAGLDADYLRADETRNVDEKAAIAIEKQALRDVTAHPSIDQARTPEELNAITLELILGKL